MREVRVELGGLPKADGSAKWACQGGSSVLVAVHGPGPCRHREEFPDRAVLSVIWQPLDTPPSLRETAMASELQALLERTVMTSFYPRSQIQVIIQPLCLDGCVMAVALNGAMMALMEAGIPLKGGPLAAVGGSLQTMDTTAVQEQDSQWTLVADAQGQLVAFTATGRLPSAQIGEIQGRGCEAAKQVHQFMRNAMERRSNFNS